MTQFRVRAHTRTLADGTVVHVPEHVKDVPSHTLTCECGHPIGDHKRDPLRFRTRPHYGHSVCLVDGCDCTDFKAVDA